MNPQCAAPNLWRRMTMLIIAIGVSPIYANAQHTPQKLHKHVPAVIAHGQADYVDKVPATQTVEMTITLPLRDQASLTTLLNNLYDPANPQYRQFLSVEQFTDRFGPTEQDYESVIQWAKSQGFEVKGTSKNRLILNVRGTVGQINTALNVSMNQYRDPKENRIFYSVDREPTLSLTVPIAHIEGLNNYSLPRPMIKAAKKARPIADVTGSGPGGYYLGSDMRAAYYGGTLLTGAGQSVGIFEFGGYRLSDVNLTFNNAGQSYNVPVNNVLIDGASAAAGSDDSEQVLDIVQAIGMAPGLSQVRVYIGNSGYDADIFNSMATENICKQLSVSWSWSPDDPSTDDGIFQEMAAQGQSIFVASGDYGAYDAAVSPYFYPGEDDYVTAVGGTHLTTNFGGAPWVAESAWNNSPYGSGGGISPDGIVIPSWQQGVATSNNAGSASLRNVPDVAMEADLDNYYCSLGSCSGGAGGTSFAAPRWAAFMALINEQATITGKAPTGGLGFINPAIYSIGLGSNYNTDFHDVASGNNDSDNQPVWYSAVTGYDLVTGWGSPNGQNLIDALAGPVVSGFWLSSLPASTSVAQNSTGTAVVSVTDAGSFNGNVSLAASGLPTGVTASFNPTSTATTSLLTLTASSSATVGTAPITITGTSGSQSSKTSLFVTVNPPLVQPPINQLGSTNIGSASGPSSLTLTFTTAGTLATIGVLAQGIANLDFANAGGGTCAVGTAYSVNATCTVNVSFTPKFAGARNGAVVLQDANGSPLATVFLSGTGVGPQATFNPGTQSTIGSGFLYPESAASLGDGSVYVTDFGAGNGTNALYLEKLSGGTYTQSKVSCTFTSPAGVAVDASGIVYVADPGAMAVYKVTILSNGTCNQTSIGSGFGSPWSVAVDPSGDVFITDLGSSTLAATVYKETLQTNGSYVQSKIGSGWISPAAIAVDSKGNIDVADGGIPGVFMETPAGGGYTQSAIGGGWTNPSGVAVDGNGNVYIADAGNSIIYGGMVPAGIFKAVLSGSTWTETAIGTGWGVPRGIAVDAGGNVYVPDQTRGVFREDLADPPALGFANAAAGTISGDSPKTEAISNLGSSSLQFSSLSYPSDFPEATGVSSDCTASTSLPAGSTCTLSVEFLPVASLGSNTSLALNESISLTTNSLNSPTPIGVRVTGTELLLGGSVSLSVSPNPAASGTPVSFTASVRGANGAPTPTGTITLSNGSTQIAGPLTLSNGVAVYSTSSLPVEVYSVVASYSGDANYQAANSSPILESIVTAPGTLAFGNTSIGSQNVGTTSSVIPLSITFSTGETLGSIAVLTAGAQNRDFLNAGGGTCTVGGQYAVNTTCTVNITFSPRFPGARFGAVVLSDNNGNVIGTGYLEGNGVGPETTFPPGTLTSPLSGFGYPEGIAIDGKGNLYVADSNNATVYKETLANGTYSQTSVGSGLNQPFGVAVDGAGNIYIADIGTHAVYKETPANGSFIQTAIGYGFISPMGVAVDALGNVYIADFGNGVNPGAVYLEALSNGSYTQSTIGTGLISPQSVTVDGTGNLYVADPANGNGSAAVYKLKPANGGYTQTTIGTQWITPTGITVDGSGNLYVTDDAYDLGDGFVLKEALRSDGTYLESTVLGSASTPYPGGVAVDWAGNLYITDNIEGVLYREDLSDPPALTFATTVYKSTSADSPKAVTVENIGNAPLNFSSVNYPADFPEALGVQSDCSSSTTLSIGAACTLTIDFTPISANRSTLLSENVTMTTNALNPAGSTQSVAVSGTELRPQATVVLSVPATVSTVGNSVAFTAVVSGTSGFSSPTGTVTFYSNGTVLSTVPLNAGSANFSTSSLSVGSFGISAGYSGDQLYASATSNLVTEQIIPASTFGTLSIGSSSSQTFTIRFPSRVTLGSIAVVTQGTPNLDFTNAGGGTCTIGTAYAAGATCTIKVSFKPLYSGTRYGAVVLGDNKGAPIQTIYIQGTGVGPQVTFAQGATSTAFTGAQNSYGAGPIAVDGNGNAYILEPNGTAGTKLTKWTLSGGNYVAQTISITTTTGYSVVVDGSGSLYIMSQYASHGQAQCAVLKEALVSGSFMESTVKSATQCNSTWYIAVDGAGNVYIADEDHDRILKESVSGNTFIESTAYTETATADGILYVPEFVAVDGSGNLYIADHFFDATKQVGTGRILKETLQGGKYVESTVAIDPESANARGFYFLALDGNGDVYSSHQGYNSLSDTGMELVKFAPSGNQYSETILVQAGSPYYYGDLGVDDHHNVYYRLNTGPNNAYQVNRLDFADPPSLTFASTNVGAKSTDSPKTIALQNSGNAPLAFSVPNTGRNPSISSASFSLDAVTTCPQISTAGPVGMMNAESSCTYAIDFAPVTTGTINGSLLVTDNALNAVNGGQTIPLNGTGTSSGASGGNAVMAMLAIGPDGMPQGVVVQNSVAPADTSGYAKVWVDKVNQTQINGFVFLQTNSQGQITCGLYSKANVVDGPSPKYGTLYYSTMYYGLANGLCPGTLFPFRIAKYTWTSNDTATQQDPFVLQVRDDYGVYLNEYGFTAELSRLANDHAVWNVCGDPNSALPTTATLNLMNPPSKATSYEWTITAPQNKMTFLNGETTITTTTPSTTIKGANASGARNDISLSVVVKGAPFSAGLQYGPLKTWVRRPNQLHLQAAGVFGTTNNGATVSIYGYQGYETNVAWQVNDQFDDNTYNTNQANVGASELVLPMQLPPNPTYPNSNWQFNPTDTNSGWGPPNDFSNGRFTDHLYEAEMNGSTYLNPTPQPPPPIGAAYQTQLVKVASQTFYAGDAIPGVSEDKVPYQGCEIQTDTMNYGIDHANENPITSPVLPQPSDNIAVRTKVNHQVVMSSGVGSKVQGGTDTLVGSILGPMPDIGFLEKRSPIIVKGRVIESETIRSAQQDQVLPTAMRTSIEVESVLKGELDEKRIDVEYQALPPGVGVTMNPNEYVLLFLERKDGIYSLVDPFIGSEPIGRSTSTNTLASTVMEKLEDELDDSLSDPDRRAALNALVQLGNLNHGTYGKRPTLKARSITMLQRVASTGDPESRGLAYSALIKLEEYSVLDAAVSFAEQWPKYSGGGTEYADIYEGGGIIGAIHDIGDVKIREGIARSGDQEEACPSRTGVTFVSSALGVLHSLVSSDSVDLRRAAVHALRGICQFSSAAVLMGALDSADSKVQYDALQGLAALEGFPPERPAPSTELFDQDPPKYLEPWKQWWEKSGVQKYVSNR